MPSFPGSFSSDWPRNQCGVELRAVNMPTPKWEKLRDGMEVLKVWALDGPRAYPQVSVLRVSNAAYLEFSRDPKKFMKFVNLHQIFPKAVIVSGPWVSLSSIDQKADQPGWVLTVVHGKLSSMIVSALPQLLQEHDDRKAK
jgi:hypothetical protein